MTWMQTHSGIAFDLLEPTPEMVNLYDIAHALSMLCRYAGHVRVHYSVAQHSCLIHDWLTSKRPKHPMIALGGLMHDGAEAYMCDIPAPVKHALSESTRRDLTAMADRIDEAICGRLGIGPHLLHLAEVKEVDLRILLDERDALMGPPPKEWGVEGPALGLSVHAWSAERARAEWLQRLRSHEPTEGAWL